MCPVIRLSDKLYERLGKHASGFESPSKVIEKILDAYEVTLSTEAGITGTADIATSSTDAYDLLELGFKSFFKVHPRPFGQKNSGKKGFSDDNNGVQWNTTIYQDSGHASLGVNLEGMKYKDWPIARLLLREKDGPSLPSLSEIPEADAIYVGLRRDAWQAAARLPIKERNITGSETPLSEMTDELWSEMVDEALTCLDENRDFKGRQKQKVTLSKTGKSVEREISPHLVIHTSLWNTPPEKVKEAVDMLSNAYERLLPVYDLMNNLTLP